MQRCCSGSNSYLQERFSIVELALGVISHDRPAVLQRIAAKHTEVAYLTSIPISGMLLESVDVTFGSTENLEIPVRSVTNIHLYCTKTSCFGTDPADGSRTLHSSKSSTDKFTFLLFTSSRSQPNNSALAKTESSRTRARLLADAILAANMRTAFVVDGGPHRTLAIAAAAIAARYTYWHCTRPEPDEPASCAAFGGCHRRCWWRARRPPTVRLAAVGLHSRAAAAVVRRLADVGLPLTAGPAQDGPELEALILALPHGSGYLTGLSPPL